MPLRSETARTIADGGGGGIAGGVTNGTHIYRSGNAGQEEQRKARIGDDLSDEVKNYSGRLTLRMPVSLHHEVAIAAAREGVSLNQFVCAVLAAELGWTTRTKEDAEARERRRLENKQERQEEMVKQAWRNILN